MANPSPQLTYSQAASEQLIEHTHTHREKEREREKDKRETRTEKEPLRFARPRTNETKRNETKRSDDTNTERETKAGFGFTTLG